MSESAGATEAAIAFDELWARSQPGVFAYICATVPSFHDATDIMQAVALTAADKFPAYDPARPFTAWVIGIARYEVLRFLRARGAERLLTMDEDLLNKLAEATERQLSTREPRHDSLTDCVEQLGDRPREVIRLRYEQGLKTAAIAEELGTTPAYVSIMLNRAYKKLRRCIEMREAKET